MATQQKGMLGDLPAAMMNLFSAQMRLGADLFESITGQPPPSTRDVSKLARTFTGTRGSCGHGAGCCTIPPPCWMPQPLGECTSHVAQCKTACVRLVITNCDRVRRTIAVQAAGPDAQRVTVSPTSVTLPPMERATVTACISIPEDGKTGEKIETLLWVRGCKEHYLRWTVSVGTAGIDSCHEIDVCDCPDYVHHWYDHFYCVRPCPQTGRTPTGATNG